MRLLIKNELFNPKIHLFFRNSLQGFCNENLAPCKYRKRNGKFVLINLIKYTLLVYIRFTKAFYIRATNPQLNLL
jgi:hypothetical protein